MPHPQTVRKAPRASSDRSGLHCCLLSCDDSMILISCPCSGHGGFSVLVSCEPSSMYVCTHACIHAYTWVCVCVFLCCTTHLTVRCPVSIAFVSVLAVPRLWFPSCVFGSSLSKCCNQGALCVNGPQPQLYIKTAKNHRRTPPPPPPKSPSWEKNQIYNRENLVGPFLVHKLLGHRPPPPFLILPCFLWRGGGGACRVAHVMRFALWPMCPLRCRERGPSHVRGVRY